MASTERTPLTGAYQAPQYVFTTNPSRIYRNRIKRFQCCVCAALLSIFVVALVITVSYSVNHDTEDTISITTTTTTATTSSSPIPETNITSLPLQMLLALTWPLQPDPNSTQWPEPQPSVTEMEAAIVAGKAGLQARDLLEETTIPLETDTPSNRHQTAMGTGEKATRYARAGYIMDVATKQLFKG